MAIISQKNAKWMQQQPREQLRQNAKCLEQFWSNLTPKERAFLLEKRITRIRATRCALEACQKQRQSLREAHAKNPEWGCKSAETLKRLHTNPEWHRKVINKMHIGRDASWADPKRREARIRATLQASHRRPTYIEQKIINILKEYSLPYKYTGDGDVVIGGACPDFVNINGHKKLIEVFGNYWHPPEDEIKKKAHYSKYGFKVLILWEKQINQMSDTEIAEQIGHFTKEV